MIDLEDRFRPIVDDSRGTREPIETIAARAQEYRRRDRARTRTRQFGAGVVVVALVVALVGIVNARREPAHTASSIATSAPPPTAPTTTTVAVPAGWKTYDYGLARLSIPPSWSAVEVCAIPRTLRMINPSIVSFSSCAYQGGPKLTIGPLRRRGSVPATQRVNGIGSSVSSPDCPPQAHCGTTVAVPSLRVQIDFSDLDPTPILRTLTYSTYARLLQRPFGPTPRSWKTISFDGIAVSTPRSWPVKDLRTAGWCGPDPDTAYYGPVTIVPSCPPSFEVPVPRDSVQISPGPPGGVGPAWTHNHLRLLRTPPAGPLDTTLSVTVLRGSRPVTVTVGLGPDPAIARGILGSIRVAP